MIQCDSFEEIVLGIHTQIEDGGPRKDAMLQSTAITCHPCAWILLVRKGSSMCHFLKMIRLNTGIKLAILTKWVL